MNRRITVRELGGASAIILHREHATVQALSRQLVAIGLEVLSQWPELHANALAADFIFFDADMGYDEQFLWEPGTSPMPLIALIGSEAPGRVEWALNAGAHAQLIKPIGDNGAYGALLIARASYDAKRSLTEEANSLRLKLNERQTVVKAVNYLITGEAGEAEAYDKLRQMAMNWRVSFEEAAQRVVARFNSEEVRNDRNGHGR